MVSYETKRYIHLVLLYHNHVEKSCMIRESGEWLDRMYDLYNLLPTKENPTDIGVVVTPDKNKPEDGIYVYINYYHGDKFINYCNGNKFFNTDFKPRGWCSGSVIKSFQLFGYYCLLTYAVQWDNTIKLEIVGLNGFQTLWFMHTPLTNIEKDNVDITDNGDTLGIVFKNKLQYYSINYDNGVFISLRYILDLNVEKGFNVVWLKLLDDASFSYQQVKDELKILSHRTMKWDLNGHCNDLLEVPIAKKILRSVLDYSYRWQAFCIVNCKIFAFWPHKYQKYTKK